MLAVGRHTLAGSSAEDGVKAMHGNFGRNPDGSPRALGPGEIPSALNNAAPQAISGQVVGRAPLSADDPRVRNFVDG
jgi:hypothetical protein